MSNLTILCFAIFIVYIIYDYIKNKKLMTENIRLGNEFAKNNAQEEGVVTTTSGLQYKVLTTGTGSVHPTKNDKVTVHYQGQLIDGSIFDTTLNRDKPITFTLKRVIKGWVEGMQLMVEGDKYRLYIPYELAYGKRKIRKIPAASFLIFDIELITIN